MTQNTVQDFASVLAGFQSAAAKTTIEDRQRWCPPTGEYHLQLGLCTIEAKTNQYGPYVQANVALEIVDPGEYQGREFTVTYLINLSKDGLLNYGGQNFVRLASILAGEPINGNDPLLASQIVQNACEFNALIRARAFQTKAGYPGIDPLSLETPTPVEA